MVHTEDQYVKSLKWVSIWRNEIHFLPNLCTPAHRTLVNDYQKPLKEACAQGKPIVSMKNLQIIFGDIELLMTVSHFTGVRVRVRVRVRVSHFTGLSLAQG